MVGPRSKIFLRLGLVIVVGLAALGMRLYFANRHVIDQDEPTYLNAALKYTNYLRSGQYTWLAWDQNNYQHPVLSKILYGIVLLTQDPLAEMHEKNFDTGTPIQSAEGKDWGLAARYTSAVLGTLASLAVAVINPLAGLFFATQSLDVISTSVIGLEALPLLTSFLAGIFYLSWVKRITQEAPAKYAFAWLICSAVALGMTAASKYTYCVVGVAIAIHFILTSASQPRLRRYYPYLAAWAGIALVAFFIFDPYLWPHPVERLRKSLLFHASYSQSSNVTEDKLPFWQPLFWLGTPYVRVYQMYRHQLISSTRPADRPAGPDRPAGIVEAGKVLFHLAGKRTGVIARLADEMAAIHADRHGTPVRVSRPGRGDNLRMGTPCFCQGRSRQRIGYIER